MEAEKLKKIEAKLRKIIENESQSTKPSPTYDVKIPKVKVIRRRKGSPDLQIA